MPLNSLASTTAESIWMVTLVPASISSRMELRVSSMTIRPSATAKRTHQNGDQQVDPQPQAHGARSSQGPSGRVMRSLSPQEQVAARAAIS